MVISAAGSAPMEVHGADGQVVAYLVSAEQMERLRGEIELLREQLETAIRQRDHYLVKCEEYLKTRFPPLLTPEEMADPTQWVGSDEIQKIIAELKAR